MPLAEDQLSANILKNQELCPRCLGTQWGLPVFQGVSTTLAQLETEETPALFFPEPTDLELPVWEDATDPLKGIFVHFTMLNKDHSGLFNFILV